MKALAKARMASKALLLASVAFVVALTGCETAPPPAPAAEAPPPPPPVLLPSRVIEMAGAYKEYVDRASAIDAGFSGGDAIAASLKTGESYEITQFQRGEAAYAAIIALQDPVFVATMRSFASEAGQRTQIANALVADPFYAATFKGADSAAGLIIQALSSQGRRIADAGAKVKQAAYDVQHQSWSKADVSDRPGRLALAKTLSSQPQRAAEENVSTLRLAATGAAPMIMSGGPVAPPYTPLVARALAVAAMASLGQGGEEYTEQLVSLLSDPVANNCLQMAKLNLYQCLAVSKPHYEDVFCLGQHILADTGQCVIKGAQLAVYVPPAPVALTPVADAAPIAKKPPPRRTRKK